MAKSGTYCEHCGAVLRSFRKYCPRCGRPTSVTSSLSSRAARGFFSRLSWPFQVLAILLLLGGAGGGGYYALGNIGDRTYQLAQVTMHVCEICGKEFDRAIKKVRVKEGDPNIPQHKKVMGLCPECGKQPVPVKKGEVHLCRKCGALIRDDTESIVVTRAEAKNYKVKRIKKELCDVCTRTQELMKKHADWGEEAANLVARGKIATGMTEEQALEAWGEPLGIEELSKGASGVQKWVFGDRVLNIPVRDRFLLMKNGKVVYYEDPSGELTRPEEHYDVPGG